MKSKTETIELWESDDAYECIAHNVLIFKDVFQETYNEVPNFDNPMFKKMLILMMRILNKNHKDYNGALLLLVCAYVSYLLVKHEGQLFLDEKNNFVVIMKERMVFCNSEAEKAVGTSYIPYFPEDDKSDRVKSSN